MLVDIFWVLFIIFPMEALNLFSHLLNLDRTCDLFWATECIRNDSVPVQI